VKYIIQFGSLRDSSEGKVARVTWRKPGTEVVDLVLTSPIRWTDYPDFAR